MFACLSKSENECLVAMKQAVRDAFEKELNNYEQMKSVANAYINKRECSIQECVYHILLGQWLKKAFPGVVFANSNIPEKGFRLCLAKHEISELPEDSKKIFKRNMVDRYIDQYIFLQNFHDAIIYHLIQNIRKMITNQKNLMMK